MFGLNKGLLVAVLAAALAPALWAQTNMVGQDAPAFTADDTINTPTATTMDECRGDVVFIYYWGTR